MDLGAFSISLPVKDIHLSYEFYQKLGFSLIGGNLHEKWIILQNKQAVIGLFEGAIQEMMLTFNPGWDQSGKDLPTFDDVRSIANQLQENQVSIVDQHLPNTGPGYLTLRDPDGFVLLIDQHRS